MKKFFGLSFLILVAIACIGKVSNCLIKPTEKPQEIIYDINQAVRVGDVQ